MAGSVTGRAAGPGARRRRTLTDDSKRGAVLHPAVAEVARRMGANRVALVDLGSAAGLNLHVDRVGITYSNGQVLGDPSSPVQLTSSVVGQGSVPAAAVPEVVARIRVDRDPVDVTDADDARWVRACVPPDQPERAARVVAELALAASAPPLLLRGDPLDLLPAALDRVPVDVLPVVVTTWALSAIPRVRRPRLVQRLDEVAAGRPVAWVSVEGVGVAPGIPTLGDRPASGHSIIGLAEFHGTRRAADAVGRCWSRGGLLAWLATPPAPAGHPVEA